MVRLCYHFTKQKLYLSILGTRIEENDVLDFYCTLDSIEKCLICTKSISSREEQIVTSLFFQRMFCEMPLVTRHMERKMDMSHAYFIILNFRWNQLAICHYRGNLSRNILESIEFISYLIIQASNFVQTKKHSIEWLISQFHKNGCQTYSKRFLEFFSNYRSALETPCKNQIKVHKMRESRTFLWFSVRKSNYFTELDATNVNWFLSKQWKKNVAILPHEKNAENERKKKTKQTPKNRIKHYRKPTICCNFEFLKILLITWLILTFLNIR